MDPTPLKRLRSEFVPAIDTDSSKKSKPKKMREKRDKKREVKLLSGKVKNVLSTAGLVGLGAVTNYMGM